MIDILNDITTTANRPTPYPTTAPVTTTVDPNWEKENEVDSGGTGNRSTALSDEVADAVKFYLYKRAFPTHPQEVLPLQSLIRQGKSIRLEDSEVDFGSRAIPSEAFEQEFDPNLETKILIHGWLNSKDTDNFQIMKENYLRKQDLNVLVVDWSKLSYGFNYLRAAGEQGLGNHLIVIHT